MLFTASPDDTFKPTGCESETFEYTPMSKVNVHWTYKKGDRVIEMGYLNIEKLRKMLLNEFEDGGVHKISREDFITFRKESFSTADSDPEDLPTAEEIFDDIIDPEGKGYFTKEDVKNMSVERLKDIARAVDVPHGPVAGTDEDEGLAAETGHSDTQESVDSGENVQEDSMGRDEL